MPLTLVRTVDPADELFTTDEAKNFLKQDVTDDDALIDSLVKAARHYTEMFTRRAFITQTWELFLDEFPSGNATFFPGISSPNHGSITSPVTTIITIPKPPLIQINSIKFLDTDAVLQTLAASEFTVDAKTEPGRLSPAEGKSYPDTQPIFNAVTINFDAGYGALSTDVPDDIITANRFLINHWYENREAVSMEGSAKVLPLAVRTLLFGKRIETIR